MNPDEKEIRELQAKLAAANARAEAAEKETDAIRELMNVYNLGGWTDAVSPMKRALAAESRLREGAEKVRVNAAEIAECFAEGGTEENKALARRIGQAIRVLLDIDDIVKE